MVAAMDGALTAVPADLPPDFLRAPLEIDLGCHRGRFVVSMAERYPDRRFLGVERQVGRVLRCRAKITRLGLGNAWVIAGEGLETLRERVPAGGAEVIHVSFPDPWPKRRHHVRRLVNAEFLRAAHGTLAAGGVLRLMTDDAPYFAAMEAAVAASAGFAPVPWDDGREYPETEFQRKFAEIGKPVYRLALRREATASA